MKILLHGNSPTVPTGYGVQIGQLARQLQAAGHEVAISSTYGVQGRVAPWGGIPIYPCGYDINSNDLLHSHADHWFDGQPGWIILCIDVWAMVSPMLKDYNVAAWCPVDHYPVPPSILKFFSETQAVPVAMSQFGHRGFQERGLDAVYIPLSVDTEIYKPTPTVEFKDKTVTGRELLGQDRISEDAFVVGMVAMNKGWAKDRKGFNEAMWAMGQFMARHDDVIFYLHTEKFGGAEGQNLVDLAIHAGIQEHRLVWAGGADQYAFRLGFTPDMMALTYSMFDVLLAPSHGEGFCVPLIEAQACGVPVIATDFSAQPELVGAGWLVDGQPEWDPAHHAAYVTPYIRHVLETLETAYAEDMGPLKKQAVEFAADYDTKRAFEKYWVPFLESLEAPGEKLSVPREPMPEENAVAVLCPVLNRPQNLKPLIDSFSKYTPEGAATLYIIAERDDQPEIDEFQRVVPLEGGVVLSIGAAHTYAEKLNAGFRDSSEFPWVLAIGDDVRFHEGWLDQARKLSTEFDVIGTNDSTGDRVRNPKVANGSHSDHTFFRRAYVDEHGGCLDGPGVLAPEAYGHWFTDVEMVSLAKARGVFAPCLDSVVEHLHPGFDGDEDARKADPTYMLAVDRMEEDHKTFMDRLPLIEQQRTTRARIR